MAYTRRQIATGASFLWLAMLTAIAAYLSSRVRRFSVPIPSGLSLATTFLPIASGILLQLSYHVTRQQEHRRLLPRGETPRLPLGIVANTLIFIYSTVVITLLGTHAAPPAGLDCALRDRWTTMFSHKNADAIRTIQDAFACCGLKHSRDMAWPFPDKDGDNSCAKTFRRTNGCLGPWKAEEIRTAALLMAVVSLVFVWQVVIIASPTQRESWFHRLVPDRVSRMITDEEHGNRGSQRAIVFPTDRYTDRIENTSEDGDDSQPEQHVPGVLTDGGNSGEEHAPRDHENAWSRP